MPAMNGHLQFYEPVPARSVLDPLINAMHPIGEFVTNCTNTRFEQNQQLAATL